MKDVLKAISKKQVIELIKVLKKQPHPYYIAECDKYVIRIVFISNEFKEIRLMKRLDLLCDLLLDGLRKAMPNHTFILNPVTEEEFEG